MAQIEYWIQIENHAWDICPSGKDRMTGMDVKDFPGGKSPVHVTLRSPETGYTRNNVLMHEPVRNSDGKVRDALILRRYTPDWGVPDDRKVNPWDLNEPDPTDHGTMGTIPGPVIEATVGDTVIVHFRNKDMRKLPILQRAHSLHAHGFTYAPQFDGAYPLTPPDP